jgi:hypothetical protein
MPASRRYIQSVLGSPEASNTVARVLEPTATMATATAAEPVAGIAALLTGDADTVGRVQDRLTYNPRSKAGQEGLKALSDAFVEMAEAVGIDDAVAYFEDTVVPSLQSRFGDEVGAAMGAGLMAGAAVIPVPARKIKAYHGSPHDFDEFSTDAIGTGEGAQAYGRGLYFAEDEKVAKSYRDALTEPVFKVNDKAVDTVYTSGIRDKFPELYDAVRRGQDVDGFRQEILDFATQDDSVDYDQLSNAIDNLIQRTFDGTETRFDFDDVEKAAKGNLSVDLNEVYEFDADFAPLDQALAEISQVRSQQDLDTVLSGFNEDQMRVYDELIAPSLILDKPEGKLYEVVIDADQDEFLDWDALVDEQPEKVRRALEASDWFEYADEGASDVAGARGDNPVGGDLVRWLEQDGAEEAAEALQNAGIKGIRYADAFTRHKSKEKRSSNYVVFDARLIEISKKLGIAIPAAAALIAGQTGQDPESLYEEA